MNTTTRDSRVSSNNWRYGSLWLMFALLRCASARHQNIYWTVTVKMHVQSNTILPVTLNCKKSYTESNSDSLQCQILCVEADRSCTVDGSHTRRACYTPAYSINISNTYILQPLHCTRFSTIMHYTQWLNQATRGKIPITNTAVICDSPPSLERAEAQAAAGQSKARLEQ